MTPALAFGAAALAVPAAWELVALLARGLAAPLRRARRGQAPQGRGEKVRLAIVALLAVTGAGALLGGAVGALIGALGVPAGVRAARAVRASRRRRALEAAAAAVARSLADGLGAGASARRAVLDAAAEGSVPGAAGEELRRLAAELRAGGALEPALLAWRRRTGDPAHATLAAALLLQLRAGGALADVLREQADALDGARRAEADADGATAQARTAARIVAAVPVLGGAGGLLLAPDRVTAIVGSPVGALLVGGAAALLVLAVVLVGRLTRRPA